MNCRVHPTQICKAKLQCRLMEIVENGEREEQRKISHDKQNPQFTPFFISNSHNFFLAIFQHDLPSNEPSSWDSWLTADKPEGEHPCEKHQSPVSNHPSLPGEGAPCQPLQWGWITLHQGCLSQLGYQKQDFSQIPVLQQDSHRGVFPSVFAYVSRCKWHWNDEVFIQRQYWRHKSSLVPAPHGPHCPSHLSRSHRWRDGASFLYHGGEEEGGDTSGEVPVQSWAVSGVRGAPAAWGEFQSELGHNVQ